MTYVLGIDVGTSHTAAAVWRDATAVVVPLGSSSTTLPSVVMLQDDGSLLVGAGADQQGATRPDRVARAFRGQVADPVPRLLGDEHVSGVELVAALLEFVVATVTAELSGAPAHVVLTCPASWGPHHRQAFTRAAHHAGLLDVGLVTEPVAAAVHYAVTQSFPVGAHLLVYDLGGADLDLSVVTRTETGYVELGRAGHDPGLGGEILDEKVLDHVRTTVRQALLQLDPDDDQVRAGLWRLRRAAVAAKEQLSTDTEVEIVVDLPGLSRRVRYTRGEFEAAIRPLVLRSAEIALETLDRAGISAAHLQAVLLTGGSSAVPLVSRILGEALAAPVVVDPRPKLAVCLGAALTGAARLPATDSPPDVTTIDEEVAGDEEAAGLVAEVVTVRSQARDLGITQPMDVALPMLPAPDLPHRRVVGDVFEYSQPPVRSVATAALLALALAVVVVVAVLIAAGVRGPDDAAQGGGGDPAVTTSDADASTATRGAAPASIATGQVLPVAVAGERVAAMAVLPDGGAVVVGVQVASWLPRVWRGASVTGPFAAVAAPAVGAGRRSAMQSVAVAGDTVVAVGWTSPEGAGVADVQAREPGLWVAGAALDQPWRAVAVPDLAELTAVLALDAGGFMAAGVGYGVDGADGDAVVLVSADGLQWTVEPGLGFDGPGPARVTALADTADGVLAAVQRRDGAVLRAVLTRSQAGQPWRDLAPLDGAGSAVAQVSGLCVLMNGTVVAVGGERVGEAAARALAWTVDVTDVEGGVPVLGVVEGFADLTAATVTGSGVVVTGPTTETGAPSVAGLTVE